MTSPEQQLNREIAELRNMHKFIGKYLAVIEETGRSVISGDQCMLHAGAETAERLKQMVKQYPKGIVAVADHFIFYKLVLDKLHESLIRVGLLEVMEDVKKQDAKRNIEQSLNDLLGFK